MCYSVFRHFFYQYAGFPPLVLFSSWSFSVICCLVPWSNATAAVDAAASAADALPKTFCVAAEVIQLQQQVVKMLQFGRPASL